MSLTAAQHTDRAAALTATDFAAILGLHPHRSPLDVWLSKTGKASAFAGNERTKWGDLLEPTIRDDYAARHGVYVEQVGTLTLEVDGVLIAATPDGLVHPYHEPWQRAERGLEIKTHSVYAADYGPDGSDEVPVFIAIQCQIGAHLAGMPRWDLVAFYDGLPHDYAIAYDQRTAETSIEAGLRWWHDHVVAHRQPAPDGSAATARAIAGMYPGTWRDPKAARWLEPTDEQLQDIAALREARAAAGTAKLTAGIIRQRLELAIGDADGLAWHRDGIERISWRRSRDGKTTDHKAALTDYQSRLQIALCLEDDEQERLDRVAGVIGDGPDLARFTTNKPGSRRFLVPRSWGADDGDTP
jgi:putative phage-type endonuclease